MPVFVRRLLALCLGALAVYLLARAAAPFAAALDDGIYEGGAQRNGSDIRILIDRLTVWLPSDCFTINWRMTGVDDLTLNESRALQLDTQTLCGEEAHFGFTYADGMPGEFLFERTVLLAYPPALVLTLTLALLALWTALWLIGRVVLSPYAGFVRLLDSLFAADAPPALAFVVVQMLFFFGVSLWIMVYQDGRAQLNALDYRLAQEYWDVQRLALTTGTLPYRVDPPLRNGADYLGTPDIAVSPLLPLLPHVTPAQYALLNVLLFYTLGFAACLRLRARWRLSLVAFAALWLLVNFNGYVVAHLAIGHIGWVVTLLLPFVVGAVLDLETQPTAAHTRIALVLAFVLGAIFIVGGFHFVIWVGWLLVFYALVVPGRWRVVALVAAGTFGLAAVRILPALVAFADIRYPFFGGYPSVEVLIDGLLHVYTPSRQDTFGAALWESVYRQVYWWEFDLYLGAVGAAFVVAFGVGARLWRSARLDGLRFAALDLPLFGVTLFSFGSFYQYIAALPIPFISSERVTSRMIIVPALFLIVVAVVRLNALLPVVAATVRSRLVVLGLLWLVAFNLTTHADTWSLRRIEAQFGSPYVPLPADTIVAVTGATPRDVFYMVSFPLGVAITLVTAAALVWAYRRTYRSREAHS